MTRATSTALAVVLAACGGGHVLGRSETLALRANDGLLVIAVDTNADLHLTLCKDADLASCTDVGPLSSASPLAVVQESAGRYCLMRMEVSEYGGEGIGSGGLAYVSDFPAERAWCFDVPAGAIAYPGHLVLQLTPSSSLAAHLGGGWDRRDEEIHAAVQVAYPRLHGLPVQAVRASRGLASARAAP